MPRGRVFSHATLLIWQVCSLEQFWTSTIGCFKKSAIFWCRRKITWQEGLSKWMDNSIQNSQRLDSNMFADASFYSGMSRDPILHHLLGVFKKKALVLISQLAGRKNMWSTGHYFSPGTKLYSFWHSCTQLLNVYGLYWLYLYVWIVVGKNGI